MARLTDDEYEAKRYTNVTQKQYTTSQNWAANYYAKYYQPKQTQQTQQQYFKQRDSQQDSDRMAELARRAREAAEKRRKEAEALRKRQEMSQMQRDSIMSYWSNNNVNMGKLAPAVPLKENAGMLYIKNWFRQALGYPAIPNYGAGGTKYYNGYQTSGSAYSTQTSPVRPSTQSVVPQSTVQNGLNLAPNSFYYDKYDQPKYLGATSPMSYAGYRRDLNLFRLTDDQYDLMRTPQPATYSPGVAYIPAGADPNAFDPYDPAGDPYMHPEYDEMVYPTQEYIDWGGGGDYWGGGGGGGYSSAPGYYGQNTGDRGRWYQNLLQWNI